MNNNSTNHSHHEQVSLSPVRESNNERSSDERCATEEATKPQRETTLLNESKQAVTDIALTTEELSSLAAANASPERIQAIKEELANGESDGPSPRAGGRAGLVLAIKANLHLFKEYSPKPLWSAKSFGTIMVKLGLHAPVKRYNFVGDLLGGHCCNLPAVQIDAVRHYDISYFDALPEEKEKRTAELTAMRQIVIKELAVAVIENTSNSIE